MSNLKWLTFLGLNLLIELTNIWGSYIDNSTDKKRIGQELTQKISKELQGWKAILLS